MPKQNKTSSSEKISQIIKKYPSEFSKSKSNELQCDLCFKVVQHKKMFYCDSHRASYKHQSILKTKIIQKKLKPVKADISSSIIKAFLESDIPLHKLRHPSIISLFVKMGYETPSESKARHEVKKIAEKQRTNIKNKLLNKPIFLIVDETQNNNIKYVHVLAGNLEEPNTSYLVKCKQVDNSNSSTITHIIDDVIKFYEINRDNFVLLISDSARYMVSCYNALSIFYPNLIHITCLLHLIHNCILNIKLKFNRVNKLISSIKNSVVKNITRKKLFENIGTPPQPVVTRWGSWLTASEYYYSKLDKVKEIVLKYKEDGIIVSTAKESVQPSELFTDLFTIHECYSQFINIIQRFEEKKFNLYDGYSLLDRLAFKKDPCNIKQYLQKRLANGDARKIVELSHNFKNLTSNMRGLIWSAQSTSIDVERSFSLLKKLLRKDRNFGKDSVEDYIMIYYNAKYEFK